jgi:hypothetical protein
MPVLLVIPLAVILYVFVSYAMAMMQHPVSHGWAHWFVRAVKFVGDQENWVLVQAVKLTRWIAHELGSAFMASYKPVVHWMNALEHYVYVVNYWALLWPIVLYREVEHLRHRTIPRMIHVRVKPIRQTAERAEADAKAASGFAHSHVHSPARPGTVQQINTIQQVAMPHAGRWDWINKHYSALQHAVLTTAVEAVAVPLPHVPAWGGRTAKQVRAHARRLTRLEKLVGVGATALAMSRVLGLPNWRCLTHGNIGRAARHFCGLDKWLVDLLLLGSVEAFVATDMCEFTHLLGIAAKAQRPILMDLVSVEDALIGCKGTTKPQVFALPSADLPPLQGVSPLAV